MTTVATHLAAALRRGEFILPTRFAIDHGVSRQNVNQILHRWLAKGAIVRDGRAWVLADGSLLPTTPAHVAMRVAVENPAAPLLAFFGIAPANIDLPARKHFQSEEAA